MGLAWATHASALPLAFRDIYWSNVSSVKSVFGSDASVRLQPGQLINHFPNHYELTRKVGSSMRPRRGMGAAVATLEVAVATRVQRPHVCRPLCLHTRACERVCVHVTHTLSPTQLHPTTPLSPRTSWSRT
jgi:hypothetical protein